MLTNYLNKKGYYEFEKNCQEIREQVIDLIEITNKKNINILEIGFNAGHSSEILLQHNLNLIITSFDLGEHNYCLSGKEYIDIVYSNRHTLILGDSYLTLPKYLNDNKNNKFDVIFIDGSYDYITVLSDLNNCFFLSHKETIIIIDNIKNIKDITNDNKIEGRTIAWNELIKNNKITQTNIKEYSCGKIMAYGYYNFT